MKILFYLKSAEDYLRFMTKTDSLESQFIADMFSYSIECLEKGYSLEDDLDDLLEKYLEPHLIPKK